MLLWSFGTTTGFSFLDFFWTFYFISISRSFKKLYFNLWFLRLRNTVSFNLFPLDFFTQSTESEIKFSVNYLTIWLINLRLSLPKRLNNSGSSYSISLRFLIGKSSLYCFLFFLGLPWISTYFKYYCFSLSDFSM